jgi:hypothetical protein
MPSVVIHEMEIVPQQDQTQAAPSQVQAQAPDGAEKVIGALEVRRIDRHMRERSLRLWAH